MSATGDTLAERFELRARLGSGGLGEVFVAWDLQTRREVALKVLDVAPIAVDRLTRLASALRTQAATEHPAIVVPRIAVATTASPPFLAGELVAGEDLGALLRRAGALPWQRALAIVHACAEGLIALGSPHRALKPGNVRVTPDEQVRVLDCAIAELGVQPAPADEGGMVAEYRAPEQLTGGPGDARSDVYTLALLLFELTTGVHPFTGPTTFQAARAALAPRAVELAPAIPLPAQVEALIARAMAQQPSHRFADVAELTRHLALIRRSPGLTPRTHAAPAVAQAPEDEPTQRGEAPASLEDRTTIVSLPSTGEARPVTPRVTTLASESVDATVGEGTEIFEKAPVNEAIVDETIVDRTEVLPDRPQAAEGTLVLSPAPIGGGENGGRANIERAELNRGSAKVERPVVRSEDDDRTVLMVRDARPPAAVRSATARPVVAPAAELQAPTSPARRSGLIVPVLLCLLSLGLAIVALWSFAWD
ncbi:serine/threonine-protein kinase [Nannocystis bainbridge]|uniref:Serine/threonine-protein kinase n=1 Tax=Nannocystis bainbridge TaxID=2995303 RepID=A0ABT5E831_9BACT|nr:serine/threonine-protein kinase [Nannocystis bainbridge]MDC0721494.1 serine/threonine-protein kinase [Nannocystis bainbridge]